MTIVIDGISSWMRWTQASCLGAIDELTANDLAWTLKQSRAITPYQAIYSANLRFIVLFELRCTTINPGTSQKHANGEHETLSNENFV